MCDVCLDDDDDEGNEILICELCLGAVHQKCYGSELLKGIPKGDWFCARCTHLKAKKKLECYEIQCEFCYDLKGMLKPIDDDKWAHLTCVRWLKGISFKDKKIEVFEGKTKVWVRTNCCQCNESGQYLLKCENKDCDKHIHVRCGIE